MFIQKTWKLELRRVMSDIEFQSILKLNHKRKYYIVWIKERPILCEIPI